MRVDVVTLFERARRDLRLYDLTLLRCCIEIMVSTKLNDAVELLRAKPCLDRQRARDRKERLRVEVQVEVEVRRGGR